MNLMHPRIHIGKFLKFTAICCVMLAVFRERGVGAAGNEGWMHTFLRPLLMAVACTLAFMKPRGSSPRCPACGRKTVPSWLKHPEGVCPSCRSAKQAPLRRRRVEARGMALLVVLFLSLVLVLAWALSPLLLPGQGWGVRVAVSLGLLLLMFGTFFAAMVLRQLAAAARMRRPRQALEVARACARETGRTIELGSVAVHAFGVDDPVPLIAEAFDSAHARLERLLSEPIARDRALRVYCFGRRNDFDAFFRRTFLFTSILDGMHLPWSPAVIAITTGFPANRLPDPERAMRMLLGYFALDSYRKRPAPLWVQLGVANLVANGGDPGELSRLNRRMCASLARGSALGADGLFHCHPRSLVRPMRNWQDLACFTAFTQLIAQSWSVTEYLAGPAAPEERRQGFRRFLQEVEPRGGAQDELMERCFQLGSGQLLDDWSAWVLQARDQAHRPPPLAVRDALLERIIPVVTDRSAPTLDRIVGVREMGRAGYVLGADCLIELLGTDPTLPRDEVVWALESISGLALGDDSRRWDEWWAALPGEATCLTAAAAPC